MQNYTKYYSYNQVIEKFDVLVMTEQEYLQNKDKLDNPQRIVLVNRAGGPREPKVPKWFESYKKETDKRFEKIEERLNNIETKLDDSRAPKWFTTYMEEFAKKNNLKL